MRHLIRKKSDSGEREQNRGGYRPKHGAWWNPLRNKPGSSGKIKRLFEGEGCGTEAQKNAADPIQRFP